MESISRLGITARPPSTSSSISALQTNTTEKEEYDRNHSLHSDWQTNQSIPKSISNRRSNKTDWKQLSVLVEVEEEGDHQKRRKESDLAPVHKYSSSSHLNSPNKGQFAQPSLSQSEYQISSNHATHLPIYIPITASQYVNSTSIISKRTFKNRHNNNLTVISSPAPVSKRPGLTHGHQPEHLNALPTADILQQHHNKLLSIKSYSTLVPSVHRPPTLTSK